MLDMVMRRRLLVILLSLRALELRFNRRFGWFFTNGRKQIDKM